jgi:hypothetical protein
MSDEAQVDFDDALARAFSRISSAKKDSKNPHFNTSYADLASVTEAIRGPLTAEGFSWPQLTEMSEDGRKVTVTTHLRRKGVCLTSKLSMPVMPVDKPTAQGVGSAITYARRYALSAITGVCPDDDDGTAASEGGRSKQPAKAKPKPKAEPKPDPAWTAARELFAKVSKRRADLIQQHGLAQMYPSASDRFAEALGVKVAPPGRDITPEQWTSATRAYGDDIDDIEMSLDAPDSDPHNGAEDMGMGEP